MYRELVEELFRIPSLSGVGLFGSDRFLAVVSNRSGVNQLWSLDLVSRSMRQISFGDDRVMHADVARDLDLVIFARDRGGNERHQIYATDSQGREKQISNLKPVRVTGIKLDDVGESIAFTYSDEASNFLALMKLDGSYENLYEVKKGIFVSDRKKALIACSGRTTGNPYSTEIIIYDLENSEARIKTPKEGSMNTAPKIDPEGRKVLFKTDYRGFNELAIMDLETEEVKNTGSQVHGLDFGPYGWLEDGDGIWYVAWKNGRSRLIIEYLNEGYREIETPEGSISYAEQLDRDRFIVQHSNMNTPPGIYEVGLSMKPKAIYTQDVSEDLKASMGKPEFITYRSFDGLEIPAYLIKSPKAKTPGPTVVWVHGGPWWEVSDEWFPSIQAFVVSGFHVIAPNFRGSTGYGSEFMKMNIGDVGGGDLKDVVKAREFAIEKGIADPSKVFIFGASYGGYMTFLATVKEPDLWRAAAAAVGVVDWIEMYELSDAIFRSFIERLFKGRPDERKDLYIDRSPTYFAENLKAPLLIWHRANDSRVPLKPVLKYALKLHELGKTFELHVVPEEGHGPQRVENILRQMLAIVEFFRKYA